MKTLGFRDVSGFGIAPEIHEDKRGIFCELLSLQRLSKEAGIDFEVSQINLSRSHFGVIRGIHFAARPPGQAKFVTCVEGRIWDVLVDLRIESSAFGRWEAIELRGATCDSVYIPEGFGHGFLVQSQVASVVYATSSAYNPQREFAIPPYDASLNIRWPIHASQCVMSRRDYEAPTLEHLLERNPHLFASSDSGSPESEASS